MPSLDPPLSHSLDDDSAFSLDAQIPATSTVTLMTRFAGTLLENDHDKIWKAEYFQPVQTPDAVAQSLPVLSVGKRTEQRQTIRKGGTQSHWPNSRVLRDTVAGLPGERRPWACDIADRPKEASP